MHMKRNFFRAAVEMSFIVFLFYANLLMGEFIRGGAGHRYGFFWALREVVTLSNFLIAILAAFIGFAVFEYLRKRY